MQVRADSLQNKELLTTDLPGLLADLLLKRQWLLATAESCTGGMIAAACTDLAGSSAWFERGFVTYSNAAKMELLGVDAALIAQHGAVSEPVARAMVQGAIAHSHAQVAVAVTGVAGPSGGSPDKPVGTVWLGWAMPDQIVTERCHFDGDRQAIRCATVHHALSRLANMLK
jgi:nicotinamide-nucleotide amidase